jgi:hypothetical protein
MFWMEKPLIPTRTKGPFRISGRNFEKKNENFEFIF